MHHSVSDVSIFAAEQTEVRWGGVGGGTRKQRVVLHYRHGRESPGLDGSTLKEHKERCRSNHHTPFTATTEFRWRRVQASSVFWLILFSRLHSVLEAMRRFFFIQLSTDCPEGAGYDLLSYLNGFRNAAGLPLSVASWANCLWHKRLEMNAAFCSLIKSLLTDFWRLFKHKKRKWSILRKVNVLAAWYLCLNGV